MRIPEGGRVLELGCDESDWAAWMKKARPDLTIIGVDVREVKGYGGDQMVVQDAADEFWHIANASSIDAVICIGSLEHFGLAYQYYGDPRNENGDRYTVDNAYHWLTPGGFLYYDVPWTPGVFFISSNNHWRCYADQQVEQRLTSVLRPMDRGYAHPHTQQWQDLRPLVPAEPFWYLARWLRKDP